MPAIPERSAGRLIPICVLAVVFVVIRHDCLLGQMRTWDGQYSIESIEVSLVYFVPADRTPLPDWKERLRYFADRMEMFHGREFSGQSTLSATVGDAVFISNQTTQQLRQGDANSIFFRTLREVDERSGFAREESDSFRILLVLCEINWRPLDDFWRLKPGEGQPVFEGQFINGQHFPGAESGGSRATYLRDRGVGWGLVSADGWRVPYRGSDCVIYHEGCGHTVGLPHPEPVDESVMGLAQYRGWIHESFLNREQKLKLGWDPTKIASRTTPKQHLFDTLSVEMEPEVPEPGQAAILIASWDAAAQVSEAEVEIQTSLRGPWVALGARMEGETGFTTELPALNRAAPVSWRLRMKTADDGTSEVWGYYQVRETRDAVPVPVAGELVPNTGAGRNFRVQATGSKRDLIPTPAALNALWKTGNWEAAGRGVVSPRQFGARLQIPVEYPREYRVVAVIEPLDSPNGFLLGLRSGGQRFAALFSYQTPDGLLSAIENIDGRNVGNESTYRGDLFEVGALSVIVVDVLQDRVRTSVDGETISDWVGRSGRLSLSEYWSTPDPNSLFLGAYDCRYRIHKLTVQELRIDDGD